MGTCAFVSFRLGLSDGVSIVAAHWQNAFEHLGWRTTTVAGEGPVDHLIPGLALGASDPPDPDAVASALADADLVVVENLLTIPMNLEASRVVAKVLANRPALLHHHDPPWQRERFAAITELPVDDPQWRHVTINKLTERQFADRGLAAITIYNGFDVRSPAGNRATLRKKLGVDEAERLFLHPVRAIERKDVPTAIGIAEELGATYWLPGPAEDGYLTELLPLLERARCPVVAFDLPDYPVPGPLNMADAYAAADLVLFPSTWEGFGNPPVEASIARRPAVVGSYPVAEELRALGFNWLSPTALDEIDAAVSNPSGPEVLAVLDANRQVAVTTLSLESMESQMQRLLDAASWKP